MRATLGLAAVLMLLPAVRADETVDMAAKMPDAQSVKEGLFPEDECKQLQAAGYKCMGFKPAVRYSLPTTNFKVGSAELPEQLRRQLDVFAEVLRDKRGATDQVVRIEGHADASGTPEFNKELSLKRAEAVKEYLVSKGADAQMLETVGRGSEAPKVASDPLAAENRRVEIGRQQAPQ
jgi:outer membrane protein OmpA-like peptidoglycan-associated protein